MLYSDSPRTIICFKDNDISLCVESIVETHVHVKCSFGSIRGGCPPVEYDSEHYVWFFHTFYNGVYTIGAYITKGFYSVVHVVDEPILVGHIQPKFKTKLTIKDNVVYPCGAVKTEKGWLISMGINDYKIGLLHVNAEHISSMFQNHTPVHNLSKVATIAPSV